MGVGETAFALVCLGKLAKFRSIDGVSNAGQITRLIVTPKLARGERADLFDERGPINATLSACDFAPMQRERTALGIAPFGFERTIVRASDGG